MKNGAVRLLLWRKHQGPDVSPERLLSSGAVTQQYGVKILRSPENEFTNFLKGYVRQLRFGLVELRRQHRVLKPVPRSFTAPTPHPEQTWS